MAPRIGRVASRRTTANLGAVLLTAALAMPLVPSSSLAQLDELCRQDADRYDLLLSFRRKIRPDRVVEVYAEHFLAKGADPETQAVWFRMLATGAPRDEAIEAHIVREHATRTEGEQAELRETIDAQIRDMEVITELVRAFETAVVWPDFTAQVAEESWRAHRGWDAPHPVEHYVDMIYTKAEEYQDAGLTVEDAAVRAGVDARNSWDRDRGVPATLMRNLEGGCYKSELLRYEMWLRHAAVREELGPLTPDEANDLKQMGRSQENISRLTYYTHMKFGPRDYSLDRFKVWEKAAEQ
ncbi:hypothetical protein [Sinorhizobium meliloti]|uniref:hypothetical protein n=1 Tax=Rhizobium meliloti TaxID=382 RepID=UPI000366F66E|nr:hypothetical protein [Sinorhizobium meliloti]